MKQLDIFGNEVDIKKINDEAKKQRFNRLTIKETFRKLHGYNKSNCCKDCKYCICNHRDKRYYKCEKIGLTNSEATDIRLKDHSCDLFKERSLTSDENTTSNGSESHL